MSGPRFAIIGTGALGGYYGARLHHAGRTVHFLLHSDFDHVRQHGLRVESIHGDFSIDKPLIHADPSEMPPCDFVIVAIKSTHNHLLPDLLPPGLGVEQAAAAVVGPDRVIGGLAFLCSNKIGPGHIRHLDYGLIRLGEFDPDPDHKPRGISDRMRQLGHHFESAGLPIVLEDDLLLARWKKLVWNVPYNGLSVVMNTTTDILNAHPATRRLCHALMHEVVAGAASFGRHIGEDFVASMLKHTDDMVAYHPSMKLDYEAGRMMEIEAIHGNPLRAAASRGVDLPRMSMLYEQLSLLASPTAARG
jgi:2-dehydropantoate 2-reductase